VVFRIKAGRWGWIIIDSNLDYWFEFIFMGSFKMSTLPDPNSLYASELSSVGSQSARDSDRSSDRNIPESDSGLLTGISTDPTTSDELSEMGDPIDLTGSPLNKGGLGKSKKSRVCTPSGCGPPQTLDHHGDRLSPNATRLHFDPESGTLAAGREEKGSWDNLGNFSIVGGIGNGADADGSLVTGAHNRIELALSSDLHRGPVKHGSSSDSSSVVPPSSAIVGGFDNILKTQCGAPVAAIGSSGVNLSRSDHVVVAALQARSDDPPMSRLKETLLTRNLKVLGQAGVDGSVKIKGDLQARSGTFDHLNVKTMSGGVAHSSAIVDASDITVTPESGLNVIYANPIRGPVTIRLGAPDAYIFSDSQSLFIKDVTPEFGPSTSHNIYITVPPTNVKIEYYGAYTIPGVPGTYRGIVAETGGTYVLNTAGGSVTFRYMPAGPRLTLPTWVIEHQLIGNQRISPPSAGEFIPATDTTRSKILRRT
jgi:hypothetical protein